MPDSHRILLLNREPNTRRLVASAAGADADGCRIEPAAAVWQFLDRLANERFALVVVEVAAAGEVGEADLLPHLVRHARQAEVLLLGSAEYLAAHAEELSHNGFGYVVAPFAAEELRLSVRQALRRHRLTDERQREQDVSRELMDALQRTASAVTPREALQAVLQTAHRVVPEAERVLVVRQTDAGTQVLGLKDGCLADFPVPGGSFLAEVIGGRDIVCKADWMDATHPDPRSLLAVPLLFSGAVLGALVVIGPNEPSLVARHRSSLATLATHAAIMAQYTSLHVQERRVDELEALHEAGRAINRSLGLQETLVTTMSVARSLVRASVSNVYLYSADTHSLDSVVTLGDDATLTDLDRQRAAETAREAVRQVLEEGSDGSILSLPPNTPPPGQARAPRNGGSNGSDRAYTKTWLAVPLVVGNVPIGVLQLGSDRADAFSREDTNLVRVIAFQAATAVRNARLYEDAQQRLRQTEALDEITRSINNTLDQTQVLHLVVRSAVRTIPAATQSALYLYDARRQAFTVQARFGRGVSLEPLELEAATQHIITGMAQKSGVTRTTWRQWSLMVAPLLVADAVIGAICIHSPFADAFSANDERFLASFASHAATAIQNANLFRDLSSAYSSLARQQKEILHEKTTLRALFDSITDGLYIVDPGLRIVAINRHEALRLGATSPDSLLSRRCDESLWGEVAPEIGRMVEDTIRTRHETNSEVKTDGRGPFAGRDVRTYPILGASGEVEQVIILAQDMAEKRWLQASLFRSANMAAVGQMASSIAHQINNPLTVIIANTQMMQMSIDPESPDYPVISDILQGGIRIGQIVRQFVDFASPEDYDWGEVEVEDPINSALTFTARSLHRSNISVVRERNELPQIIASSSQLTVVWMNLLLNARDAIVARRGVASEQEPGRIEIRTTQPDAGHVRVEIVDNGEGIPDGNRDRLFHPFFTTRPPGKGMGLGLFTSRKIIECHQGHIQMDANPAGPGTVAAVTLPLVADPRVAQPA